MGFDILSNKVIGCALQVHKQLGPGLLESAYECCLARELELAEIPFKLQVPIPIHYKGEDLDCGYRIDILVEDTLLVELKSVQQLLSIYDAQILTYMKLAKIKIGLLINCNGSVMVGYIIKCVTPAKAGVQVLCWIPAFAGMTSALNTPP